MKSKLWKIVLLIILILACLFDITYKLIRRETFNIELSSVKEYLQNLGNDTIDFFNRENKDNGPETLGDVYIDNSLSEKTEGEGINKNITITIPTPEDKQTVPPNGTDIGKIYPAMNILKHPTESNNN